MVIWLSCELARQTCFIIMTLKVPSNWLMEFCPISAPGQEGRSTAVLCQAFSTFNSQDTSGKYMLSLYFYRYLERWSSLAEGTELRNGRPGVCICVCGTQARQTLELCVCVFVCVRARVCICVCVILVPERILKSNFSWRSISSNLQGQLQTKDCSITSHWHSSRI